MRCPKVECSIPVAKRNNGKSARTRRYRYIFICAVGIFIAVFLVSCLSYKIIETLLGPDTATTKNKMGYGHKKFGRKSIQFKDKDIIENYWTMIHLQSKTKGALEGIQKDNRQYGKIEVIFCEIDWSLQEDDPSVVPMFRDLQARSKRCAETNTVSYDLHELVKQAKAFDGFDEHNQDGQNTGSAFPPTGVVFHETRCGSTLFANMLAGFAPERSRAFSESHVPLSLLKTCESDDCNEDAYRAFARDVFYMLGRRPPPRNKEEKQHLFFKIQSVGVWDIHKFTMVFPEVPWVFVYRDTVEIMQSLLRQGAKRNPKVCTRYRTFPASLQPATTLQVIVGESGKKVSELSIIEYCAAHLGGLTKAALNEYDRTSLNPDYPGGRFVDYHQMPDIVWNEILPDHFGVDSVTPEAIVKMQKIAGVYSKARGVLADSEWTEDSSQKQETASKEVIEVADRMVSKYHKRMKEISYSE